MKRLLLILLTLLAIACSGSSGGGAERWPDLPDSIDDGSVIEPVSHRTVGKEVDDQMHQSGFYWS